MVTKLIRVHGRVQGVWYRSWTVKTATALNLKGWVRNRSDGTVEALFMGPDDTVEQMISACRQGPPAAFVKHIETTDAPAEQLGSFEQRETV